VLDGKSEPVEIIGSDGSRGAYRDGSTIAVIGVMESGQSPPTITPQYLAPNAGSFYNGQYSMGWFMVVLGFLPLPVFWLSFWALLGRYRSHWRRLQDFGTGPSVKPLGSVAEVHAVQARVNDRKNKNGATNETQAGLTVEELTKQLK
jgi:hypothetical protein